MTVRPSAFDAEAFGVAYYRVHDLDGLEDEVRDVLSGPGSVVIDAKRPAEDVVGAGRLQHCGFRKVCMQVALTAAPREAEAEGVTVSRGHQADPGMVLAHARNFRFDRFSLDPAIAEAGRVDLYRRWIANSLAGLDVAHTDGDFCSFKRRDERLVIDLVSVLRPHQGIGRRLVRAVLGQAHGSSAAAVDVVTECENRPAWRLYAALGFTVDRYVQVFHLVRP